MLIKRCCKLFGTFSVSKSSRGSILTLCSKTKLFATARVRILQCCSGAAPKSYGGSGRGPGDGDHPPQNNISNSKIGHLIPLLSKFSPLRGICFRILEFGAAARRHLQSPLPPPLMERMGALRERMEHFSARRCMYVPPLPPRVCYHIRSIRTVLWSGARGHRAAGRARATMQSSRATGCWSKVGQCCMLSIA